MIQKQVFHCKWKEQEQKICLMIGTMENAISEADIKEVLSEEEEHRFAELNSIKRKMEMYYGRLMAKNAVIEVKPLEDVAFNEMQLVNGIFHYPLMKGIFAECGISISHSGNYVAAIAYPRTLMIGLDIEVLNYETNRSIGLCVEAEEQGIKPPHMEEMLFAYIVWTCKEALGKCIGLGLGVRYGIYRLEGMEGEGSTYRTTFRNFPQFIAYTSVFDTFVYTIVCPKPIVI